MLNIQSTFIRFSLRKHRGVPSLGLEGGVVLRGIHPPLIHTIQKNYPKNFLYLTEYTILGLGYILNSVCAIMEHTELYLIKYSPYIYGE